MTIQQIVRYAGTAILLLHGLIHIIGVLMYWKIAELEDFGGYKTALLGGRLEVGDAGMRVFGALWGVAMIGFVIAAYGVARQRDWWLELAVAVTLFSLVLTVLDWNPKSAGPVINLLILDVLIVVTVVAML